MADEPFWDEFGRGPMQRELHRRDGYDPAKHAAGFASFAQSFLGARGDRPEWPERFRAMLLSAVRKVLDDERAVMRADAEAWIESRLVPVREAYAALLERVKRLEQRNNLRPPHAGVRATQTPVGSV